MLRIRTIYGGHEKSYKFRTKSLQTNYLKLKKTNEDISKIVLAPKEGKRGATDKQRKRFKAFLTRHNPENQCPLDDGPNQDSHQNEDISKNGPLVQNGNLINCDAVLLDIQNADLVPENLTNDNDIGPVEKNK